MTPSRSPAAGISVLAVDRDPLTAEVARANAAALGLDALIEVRCADVTEIDTAAYDAVFVDPARRGGRGRIFDPEAYSPPLSWATGAALKAPRAALKIAPGIPHEAVPAQAEAEWISDGGDVKEAVLWFGEGFTAGSYRATLLPAGATLSAPAALPAPPVGPVGRYLYEPDGAVIRAHLVADIVERSGGRLIDETIAYVTSDEPYDSPYTSAYEITDRLPFNMKKLKALLRERKVGVLTVKKRGSAVEPEELRRKMKLQGPNAATVFLTRVAGAPTMLIGHPVRPEMALGQVGQVFCVHLGERLRADVLLAVALPGFEADRLLALVPGRRDLDPLMALALLVVLRKVVRAAADRLRRTVRRLDGQAFLLARLQQFQLAGVPVAQRRTDVVDRPSEAAGPEDDEHPPVPLHVTPSPCADPATRPG